MSIRTYKEGEHPSGFIGCRVTIGSNCDSEIYSKYVRFKNDWGYTQSLANKIEQQARAQYGFIQGKARRCFDYKTKANQGDKDLVTIIRGVSISRCKKKKYLKDGGNKYAPHINICMQMYSRQTNEIVRVCRLCKEYQSFCKKWNEIVDLAVYHYGLKRAKKGWREVPITESVFNKKMDALTRECERM